MRLHPVPLSARQRGLAALEMAVIAPVFLLLMMGAAELGHAFYESNTLNKAVRNGARYLAERAAGGAGVIDIAGEDGAAARNLIVYGNAGGAGAPVLDGFAPEDVAIATVDAGHFRVTATYRYRPLFAAIPGFGVSASVEVPGTLVATYTMRAL